MEEVGAVASPLRLDPDFPAADWTLASIPPQPRGDHLTVALLHINDEYRVRLRELLIVEGAFPPG